MKKFFILITLLANGLMLHANLLENPQFASKNTHTPDKWLPIQKKVDLKVFNCQDGVLSISEKSSSYGNNISQFIPVDGLKSYYFECEYRCDGLNFIGAITYDFFDSQKKRINKSEYYILKTIKPQNDWKKIVYKIGIGNPDVHFIKLNFCNYRSKEMLDKKIHFRNPVFRAYNGENLKINTKSTTSSAQKKQKNEVIEPFQRHKFIHKPFGMTYSLERGGAGFFRVETPHFAGKKVSLAVRSVKGVNFELYLYDGLSHTSCKIKPEMRNGEFFFDVANNFRWKEWGNALIFAADKTAPDKFDIEMDFIVKNGPVYKYKIPVEQTAEVVYPAKLPEHNFLYSYHTFPLMRVPKDKIKGTLLEKLEKSWINCGWRRFSFNHIFGQIPVLSFHYKGKAHKIKPGLAPDGAETHFYCDSSYSSFSPEYYAKLLTANKIADTIRNSSVIFWDYEPYVGGAVTLSCYCEKCLKSFADTYSLKSDISPREILTKYLDKWIRFRCKQRSLSVIKIIKAIKLINPKVKVLFCSAPLPPDSEKEKELEYLKFYGIDIREVDKFVDIHASMNYTPTLDYYKSLEREAKELKSQRMMIFSNSWEEISNMRPKRVGSHLFAAIFMGCNPPFIGQGLFLAPGTLLAQLKTTVNDVASTEKYWYGSEYDFDKLPWQSLYMADGNFYMLGRKNKSGKILFLVNNHEFETIYIKLLYNKDQFKNFYDLIAAKELIPCENGVAVAIPPHSYRMIKCSINKEPLSSNGVIHSEKIVQKAASLLNEQQAAYKALSKYNIHCRRVGEKYEVAMPTQKVIFNLNNGAEAEWFIKGKKIMTVGKDSFIEKDGNGSSISDVPVKLDSCKIFPDRAECTFSYRVANEKYRELRIRKKFTVNKNSDSVTVDVEILPEGGFRNFRYRMNNILAIGSSKKSSSAYHTDITYLHGNINDKNGNTVVFADDKLNSLPLSQYIRKRHRLNSKTITAVSMRSNEKIEINTSDKPDLFFCWRYAGSATIEPVYPAAYPTEDPHLVKNWHTQINFKYSK